MFSANVFHTQLFANRGKSSVARPAFFSPHGHSHPSETAGAGRWIFPPARNQLQQPHVQRYCQPIFSTHSCSPTEASLLLLDLRSSPRTARHIRAKPPVRADGFFFLTAISHDSRMFSDVFGPHFPAASSPRAHGKRSASYMLCPANLFPFRMRSVMATANSRDASRFLSAVDWTDAQKQRCQRARRRASRA